MSLYHCQTKRRFQKPNNIENHNKIKHQSSLSPEKIIEASNTKNNTKNHGNRIVHGDKAGKTSVDEDGNLSQIQGSMKQYCVKGSDVILRHINFTRSDSSRGLSMTVDNRKQVDNYTILFTKDVCPFNFKDSDAFVIKVLDEQQKIKSMTFKTSDSDVKSDWLETYGINLDIAHRLLEGCIEEIEKRRFHLGIKKRNEDRNRIKVTSEMLIELLESIKHAKKLDLNNNHRWSVTSLERLIQILLNELVEPLIPYHNQRFIRKANSSTFNSANETRKILNSLPDKNRAMLSILLGHMERLSKYYLIIMSSPRKDLPHIRLNICQRLTPIIFRLQEELDSEPVLSRACDILYHTMLCINGATESSDRY